jgi:hypothetical protein
MTCPRADDPIRATGRSERNLATELVLLVYLAFAGAHRCRRIDKVQLLLASPRLAKSCVVFA